MDMIFALLFSAITGFYHVEKAPSGRWQMIDPAGKETFLCGINTVNYAGSWCSALKTHPYKDENKRHFPSEAAWAEDSIARMKRWGFNCLGAHSSTSTWTVCDIPHVKILMMGMKFARLPGKEHCLFPYEGRPESVYPNVWHPDFGKWCEEFARENCAALKDDPKLVGYYIDNELQWKKIPTLKPDDREFLGKTAERYFSVTASAIRKADPNHMIMGCRFAGMSGAEKEVYAIAGKYCEVVSFNNYPWADINCNFVNIYTGYEVKRAAAAFSDASAWAGGRPLIVSEWSFPALDSGLPCTRGAGVRYMTQKQRAAASELYAKVMMANPNVVGYSYFKWTDQPSAGVSSTFGENTNYGVNTIKGDIYKELTDMFARVQNERMKWRYSPPPAEKAPPPPDPGVTAAEAVEKMRQECSDGGKVLFTKNGNRFSVSNSAGLKLEGTIGGSNIFDVVASGGKKFGTWNVMLCSESDSGKKGWALCEKVEDVRYEEGKGGIGILHVKTGYCRPWIQFEFDVCIYVAPGSSKFIADVVSLRNLKKKTLKADRVYLRPEAAFLPKRNAIIPSLWRPLKNGGWRCKDDSRFYNSCSASGALVKMEFPLRKDGTGSPEIAFRPFADFSISGGGFHDFNGLVWGEFSVGCSK